MKNFKIAAAILGLALSGAARATTFTADFSSTSLDPQLTAFGTTSLVSSGGGFLTVAYPTPSGTNSGVFTNFVVTGDFTATATFNIANLPVSNAASYYGPAICGSGVNGNQNAACVSAYKVPIIRSDGQPGVADLANGFENIDGVYTPSPQVAVADMMTFRVQRLGDTVTESSSFDGTTFQLLGTYTGSEMLGDWAITLGGFDNGTELDSGSSTFSNFTVDYADAVPEPTSWALFIGGFGMMGTTLRGSRKGAIRAS